MIETYFCCSQLHMTTKWFSEPNFNATYVHIYIWMLQWELHLQQYKGLIEKELKPKFEVSGFNVLLGRFDNTTINNCLRLSQAFGGNNADN